MYFPYFRGKRFELIALAELTPLLSESSRITASLEPVRTAETEVRKIRRLAQEDVPLILIENPNRGELATRHDVAQGMISQCSGNPNLIAGFLVGETTQSRIIEEVLHRNRGGQVAFVHLGSAAQSDRLAQLQVSAGNVAYNVFLEGRSSRGYREGFTAGRPVILDDPFERRTKNEDYPPHEFFSDRHNTYRGEGFYGFGDFLTVGNHFTETGGAALAVAIHLTNREGNNELWIRHFVSDRTSGRGVDTPGKFLEALAKTVTFIRSRANWRLTAGGREFIELHSRQHFPGLGFVKKVSMKHHVELLDAIVAGS